MKKISSVCLFVGMMLFLGGCGALAGTMFGMEDTPACRQMERACREAGKYRKQTRELGMEKNSYRKEMQRNLDEQCAECHKACHESQPETRRPSNHARPRF
ncbi:MAG: hypothetical protein GF344_15660 [Chitinivibrionales bacterium]|nr:hypothetical protein [Chitinivibrionales bacterium]MBD3358137.1 hypothetical protein [Chitinivibrionales bacterium]